MLLGVKIIDATLLYNNQDGKNKKYFSTLKNTGNEPDGLIPFLLGGFLAFKLRRASNIMIFEKCLEKMIITFKRQLLLQIRFRQYIGLQ